MNPERVKYEAIYSNNAIPGYGSSCHGQQFIDQLSHCKSLIDVGCGDNALVKQLRKLNQDGEYIGIDFACTDADIVADVVDGLRHIDSKHYDMLTAFDVMEHMRPGQLHAAISTMQRISKQFMMTISFRESLHTVNGQPLHMTVQPDIWWMHALDGYAKDVRVTAIGNDSGLFEGIWL